MLIMWDKALQSERVYLAHTVVVLVCCKKGNYKLNISGKQGNIFYLQPDGILLVRFQYRSDDEVTVG